jgi:ATP/maltotriose-dependent transcriptional regulator MalT
VTANAIPVLEESGDDLGLARAWRLRGEVAVLAGQWGVRADALERALEHARSAADKREEATLVGLLAMAFYFGPTPVDEAISRCRAFLAEMRDESSLEAALSSTLAGLLAMQGDFEEARKLWAAASDEYEELGLGYRRAVRSTIAADIEALAGDEEAAERELRSGYETLKQMGETGARAVIAAYLADCLARMERDDEATGFAEIAADLAAADDLVPQVLCRSVQAKVLARRGEAERAEKLAREAAAMVETTDFPDLQAQTLVSLAEVLEYAGTTEEARSLVDRAHALYTKKENVAALRRMVQYVNSHGRR